MATTITWQETGKAPAQLTINDDAMTSLEQYRLTMTRPSTERADAPDVPIYPDVFSMILTVVTNVLIQPAFRQFPTTTIQTAAATAAAAAAALAQAEQAFIQGSLSVATQAVPVESAPVVDAAPVTPAQ